MIQSSVIPILISPLIICAKITSIVILLKIKHQIKNKILGLLIIQVFLQVKKKNNIRTENKNNSIVHLNNKPKLECFIMVYIVENENNTNDIHNVNTNTFNTVYYS